MADLSNGCDIRQPTHSDDSVIQDKCFEPVAIIGMGKAAIPRISYSFALIIIRLSMAWGFHTALGVMGFSDS